MFHVSQFVEVIVCLNSQKTESYLFKLKEEFLKVQPLLRTGGLFPMGSVNNLTPHFRYFSSAHVSVQRYDK